MNPLIAITTMGFRRWYEQQRIQSRAALIGCLLCMMLLTIGLESALPLAQSREVGLSLLLAVAAAAGMVASWQHFRIVFTRAGRVGSAAHCEHCGTFARFDLRPAGTEALSLEARCRHCLHRWILPQA